ncbi:MAG: dephospho-CoA kinase [Coraliomargaritaceae bacterium]
MNIGLTGGIGCGKSTVAGFFSTEGWKTTNTDRVAADVLSQDTAIRESLRQRWGSEIFISDQGDVDRKAIAQIVFSDPNELDWLEGLLHPVVRQHWVSQLEYRKDKPCLVEIPLLFEKSLESHFDLVVCVITNNSVADTRLVSRGLSSSDIARRRRRQFSIDDKMRLADHVLYNSGSIEFLKRQTLRLIQQIQSP